MRTSDYVSAAKELRSVTDARATQLGAWVVMAARWYQENDFTEFHVPPGRYRLPEPLPLLTGRNKGFSIINEGEVEYSMGPDCFSFMSVKIVGDGLGAIDINSMSCEA